LDIVPQAARQSTTRPCTMAPRGLWLLCLALSLEAVWAATSCPDDAADLAQRGLAVHRGPLQQAAKGWQVLADSWWRPSQTQVQRAGSVSQAQPPTAPFAPRPSAASWASPSQWPSWPAAAAPQASPATSMGSWSMSFLGAGAAPQAALVPAAPLQAAAAPAAPVQTTSAAPVAQIPEAAVETAATAPLECLPAASMMLTGFGCINVAAKCPSGYTLSGGGCDMDYPSTYELQSRKDAHVRESSPKRGGWHCQFCSHDWAGRDAPVGGKAWTVCCK